MNLASNPHEQVQGSRISEPVPLLFLSFWYGMEKAHAVRYLHTELARTADEVQVSQAAPSASRLVSYRQTVDIGCTTLPSGAL